MFPSPEKPSPERRASFHAVVKRSEADQHDSQTYVGGERSKRKRSNGAYGHRLVSSLL
jgi:hypothetical protein